jgi:hypothetical protein
MKHQGRVLVTYNSIFPAPASFPFIPGTTLFFPPLQVFRLSLVLVTMSNVPAHIKVAPTVHTTSPANSGRVYRLERKSTSLSSAEATHKADIAQASNEAGSGHSEANKAESVHASDLIRTSPGRYRCFHCFCCSYSFPALEDFEDGLLRLLCCEVSLSQACCCSPQVVQLPRFVEHNPQTAILPSRPHRAFWWVVFALVAVGFYIFYYAYKPRDAGIALE